MIVWTDLLDLMTARDLRLEAEARAELEASAAALVRSSSPDYCAGGDGRALDLALLIVELEAELETLRGLVAIDCAVGAPVKADPETCRHWRVRYLGDYLVACVYCGCRLSRLEGQG